MQHRTKLHALLAKFPSHFITLLKNPCTPKSCDCTRKCSNMDHLSKAFYFKISFQINLQHLYLLGPSVGNVHGTTFNKISTGHSLTDSYGFKANRKKTFEFLQFWTLQKKKHRAQDPCTGIHYIHTNVFLESLCLIWQSAQLRSNLNTMSCF